jgi:hypothetical protein
MISAEIDAAHAVSTAMDRIDKAFEGRAHQIAQFSAPISVAEANKDARTMMADAHEADVLGPSMARMIDAETELNLTVRDALLPIKKFVVETLAERLERIEAGVKLVADAPEILNAVIQDVGYAIIDAVGHPWRSGGIIEGLFKRLPEDIEKARKRGQQEQDPAGLFEKWFGRMMVARPVR